MHACRSTLEDPTDGAFEAWRQGGERFVARTATELRARLPDARPPGAVEIAALETWFVAPGERRLVRLLRALWSADRRRAPARERALEPWARRRRPDLRRP